MQKKPLNIYVLWHPDFSDGEKYAEAIFSTLSRNVNSPLERGIGIPVFFRSVLMPDKKPVDIEIEEDTPTVVVILVDTKMVINPELTEYIKDLSIKINSSFGLLPVAISDTAFNLEADIDSTNYIRLYEQEEENKINYLLFSITHELCRLLYNKERVGQATKLSPSPVKLFLSHAKKDGVHLAKEIRGYIGNETALDTFFDSNDIAAGFEFSKEINGNIEQSVLLVLHTDAYGSREWCRKEVLAAKEAGCPIVIINSLEHGETRSFPYMANVPTIHWNVVSSSVQKSFLMKIIQTVLLETLRFKYQNIYMHYLVSLYKLKIPEKHILSSPPEMLTFLSLDAEHGKTALYPDPPLGAEEMNLLSRFSDQIKFITSIQIPLIGGNSKFLEEKKVALSISESSDIEENGLSLIHLQDVMIEVTRHLLAGGATVVYGGDVRYSEGFNFAELLFDLIRTYNSEFKEQRKAENYVAYPIHKMIDEQTQAKLMKVVKLHFINPSEKIDISQLDPLKILKAPTVFEQMIWVNSLTQMREQMNKNIHVRVIMGGKTKGYKGKYPGLVEECILSLRKEMPVYLIGALGGCSQKIIDALQGQQPKELTDKYQLDDLKYSELVQVYNDSETDIIDYAEITSFLNNKGKEVGYGLNNGLSNKENDTLFNTKDIPELIALILKGLKTVLAK